MSKTDPLTHGPAARLSLPFLPTLVTALLIGGASLLCREPAAQPPAASIAPRDFHPALPVEASLPRAPAMIAFAEQYPVRPASDGPLVALAPRPAARLAAARRPCTGPHCGEAAARRPEPSAAPARPQPVQATAEVTARAAPQAEAETAGGFLPDIALPFAPVVRVAGETADFVRTGAASLGGSLSVMVDRLR